MKKMRIPLLIALGVAIVGIILGSFFDYEISKAIASPNNGFGLTVSAILPTVGFMGVAVMGGGFLALALKGDYHIGLKIMFYVLAAACLGVSIYYPAGEYFGINGFYEVAPKWVGYFIVVIPEVAAMVGGYFLFRNCKNKNMWIIFSVVVVLLLITLVAALPIIKDNMRRPRFRIITKYPELFRFHNWYEPNKEYTKAIGEEFNSDNFKSFPSGHTAEVSILLVAATFFPMADKKFEKYQLPLFLGACGLVLLVALARILAAAHFLSDVSMGAAIILIFLNIANEVIIHIKALHLEEEKVEK